MSYTAIILDDSSKKRLLQRFIHLIPKEWEIIDLLHMTINMGPITKGPADPSLLGQDAELTVVSIAGDDKVMAVGVVSDVPSKNAQKHITIAVNRAGGGKPYLSNKLTEWEVFPQPFDLFGIIQEVG